MTDFLEVLIDKLEDHWVKIITAAAFMVIGWFFGKRKAAKDWEKREFFDRLNISLNIIRDGKLKLRTLNETRWTTLQKLAVAYQKTPYKFVTVELCQ